MKKAFRISKEVKDQILDRIKNEGISVYRAAKEHGVSTGTIYNWLSKGVSAQPTWTQLNKLKKENKMLFELVGELTMKLSSSKKKK
jgi:transposase-like protein